MVEFVRLPDVAMAVLRLRDGGACGLPSVGTWAMADHVRIVAIGPDEWLAIAPDGDDGALRDALASYGGSVIDASGNRVCFEVTGSDPRWFLAAGCSCDLDALVPGKAISTLLARAQVVIVADAADRFLVLPRRSYARYLEEWATVVDR